MFENLYARMRAKHISQVELARIMDISPKSLYNKLNGKTDFNQREMKIIQVTLGGSLDWLFDQVKQ